MQNKHNNKTTTMRIGRDWGGQIEIEREYRMIIDCNEHEINISKWDYIKIWSSAADTLLYAIYNIWIEFNNNNCELQFSHNINNNN